ncbi:molecular mechanism For the regulation of protein kinase B Akt By hydrophobic motif phosphorylation [Rozella allomycis CSF55]|uniref:Molecular mechanism For the regulation of protein kinase B Akt By hydrophobic motif phosphorylation n=1 Tax=Rozella allomycis (strain CSF55) TaxID=988480 RepID=A0A4P9YF28_ROZAC|nr:molecular mechanism For the regulation of protein kinase B Akt By hydrophobic motif phosphorylation [Rozella allomycis CSF55]
MSFKSNSTANASVISISDFEIIKVLGQGQYGKVYLSNKKSTDQLFAIKVLKKKYAPETSVNENKLLRGIMHPFLVSLHYAFQTRDKLYLVMEYVNGGELFFHLQRFGKFSFERAQFYAAEMLLALECLHGKGYVYRDLKLENILLDKDGHIRITDFGLCKRYDETTKSFSGTLEYFAPEVILFETQGFAADWWAFGIIIFEMTYGFHPFYSPNRHKLYEKILREPIHYPNHLNTQTKSIIEQFLVREPQYRLGCGSDASCAIRRHEFFHGVDFNMVFKKLVRPPFVPDLRNDIDTRYFDQAFTDQAPVITESVMSSNDELHFEDFSFRKDTDLLN